MSAAIAENMVDLIDGYHRLESDSDSSLINRPGKGSDIYEEIFEETRQRSGEQKTLSRTGWPRHHNHNNHNNHNNNHNHNHNNNNHHNNNHNNNHHHHNHNNNHNNNHHNHNHNNNHNNNNHNNHHNHHNPELCPPPLYLLLGRCWSYQPPARPSFSQLVCTLSDIHEDEVALDAGRMSSRGRSLPCFPSCNESDPPPKKPLPTAELDRSGDQVYAGVMEMIEGTERLLNKDLGELIGKMRLAQQNAVTSLGQECRRQMLAAAHALAVDSKSLLEAVDLARVRAGTHRPIVDPPIEPRADRRTDTDSATDSEPDVLL
ncbi:hypothetical protein CRUP_011995 [Coryphaenoides rupestris]|nr:hypothetical protein CRUP_011995 [Coryphaenoides rupestris]